MKTQVQIFLAHASEDEDLVRQLHAQLATHGFKPWMSEIDLMPGQNWRVEIPKVIEQCQIFLACLSRRCVEKSGYVQQEFRLALDEYAKRPPGSVYLIPVKFDECPVPDLQRPQLGVGLRDIHWVDLWKPDGLDRLVGAIDDEVGKSGSREESKKMQTTKSDGLRIESPLTVVSYLFEFETGRMVDIVIIKLQNIRADKTFDDVIIELKLPAGIAFVNTKVGPGNKPLFGHVTIPLPGPVHPGASRDIGYVKKHFDLDNPMAGMFSETEKSNELEWKITARDVPATLGSIDISQLIHNKD